MGSDINFFVTKYLKMYNPSSDESIFGPIRRLPIHILSTLGLETTDVSDQIEATEGIDPYLPTPPLQNPSAIINPEGTIVPSSTTLSNISQYQRRKRKVFALYGPRKTKKQGTPKKDASKPSKPSKKRKTQLVITIVEPSRHVFSSDSDDDDLPIAILKKRKTDLLAQDKLPFQTEEDTRHIVSTVTLNDRKFFDDTRLQFEEEEEEVEVEKEVLEVDKKEADPPITNEKILSLEATADQNASKVPPTPTVQESQDEGPEIEVSSAPTFGLDDDDLQEENKPSPSDDDFLMFDEEEESNGSHHSTSKPKEKKKKKKNVVTRNEVFSLQEKIDQILATVKPTQPQPEDIPGP
ncbi:uncharacterized protein LOC111913132 [Lactuca sativa]|uniref:uncharacterized protein LOC111913132 n=1 Tax=Lactuca sativa TaxID=4236 RepID=UPI000CD9284B|nr:uncharacterized protein LOC111913132 [Lactuca sativa]